MYNTSSIKNVLCAVLVISMAFSAAIPVLAEFPFTAPATETESRINNSYHKQYLEEAVLKLVQEGKLSKEKAERVLEYRKKKAEEFNRLTKGEKQQMKDQLKKGSLLNEMKREGILTEEEVKTIRAKLREMKEARMSEGLQKLVDNGVLTSDDINNIRDYMLKIRDERKTQIEKLKSMTPEQRKEYFNNSKNERKDILTRMVEDKVITQKQADEIKKAIPELNKERCRKSKDNRILQ